MRKVQWRGVILCGLLTLGLVLSNTKFGEANSDVKKLVDTLVEKKLISYSEGQDILKSSQASSEIPSWIKSIKLKGDFRARYQYQKQKNSASRERGRIRYRIGIISSPNDAFEVGFGLASGPNDPRSTNATLENTFESKEVRLDYAYAKYIGNDTVSAWVGKYNGIGNTLWLVSDLLWDGDITPEGVGAHIKMKPADGMNLFVNTGYLILDELSNKADPSVVYFQPGVEVKLSDKVKAKLAFAYYITNSLKGKTLDHSSNTNTKESNVLKYDYDAISPSFEISVSDISKVIPYFALFGEYVKASDPEENNKGYLAGVKFGSKKLKKLGDWQFQYGYRKLEKDAWIDALPDSDALSGKTNAKGHKMSLTLALMENVSFGLNYYDMEAISGSTEEKLFQTDVVWKF